MLVPIVYMECSISCTDRTCGVRSLQIKVKQKLIETKWSKQKREKSSNLEEELLPVGPSKSRRWSCNKVTVYPERLDFRGLTWKQRTINGEWFQVFQVKRCFWSQISLWPAGHTQRWRPNLRKNVPLEDGDVDPGPLIQLHLCLLFEWDPPPLHLGNLKEGQLNHWDCL